MRFIVERKPYYISTGVRVRASEFRYGKIVGRADAAALNKRLNALMDAAHEEVTRRIEEKLPIDVACIRRKLYGQDEENANVGMLEWINEEISTLRVKAGTKMHYKVLYDRLCQFGKMSEWKDLTAANICKFDSWLHSLKKDQRDADKKAGLTAELLSDGAVYNYHKCLKALLNRAVLFDLIERNPYDKLKGQFSRGDVENVEYLTDNEVEAFISIHPLAGSNMAVSRDLFIIQLYTGMSFSDAQAFNIKDYQVVDGKWMNVGKRVKTGVPYVSMLLPPVVDMLKRNGWRVPKMNNQRYNQMLKAIGMVIGIERLHSHMGRHTFATWMLSNGSKIENVSKMLGHTDIKMTQRYAEVLAKDVYDDYDKAAEKFTAMQSPGNKRSKKEKQ